MSSFGTAFLQTTADAANKKFAEKTAEENKVKDEQRKMYWGIAYDTTGQYNDAQKSAALEQYNKLIPASLRKPSQKFNGVFGTLSKAAQAHAASQAQNGQQPPQSAAQPSPAGKLSGPSTPAPDSSTATLAMPPGGGAMTTQSPATSMAGPQTPKPSPTATPAMTGPKTPPPQPAQGIPIQTSADRNAMLDSQAQADAKRQSDAGQVERDRRTKVADDPKVGLTGIARAEFIEKGTINATAAKQSAIDNLKDAIKASDPDLSDEDATKQAGEIITAQAKKKGEETKTNDQKVYYKYPGDKPNDPPHLVWENAKTHSRIDASTQGPIPEGATASDETAYLANIRRQSYGQYFTLVNALKGKGYSDEQAQQIAGDQVEDQMQKHLALMGAGSVREAQGVDANGNSIAIPLQTTKVPNAVQPIPPPQTPLPQPQAQSATPKPGGPSPASGVGTLQSPKTPAPQGGSLQPRLLPGVSPAAARTAAQYSVPITESVAQTFDPGGLISYAKMADNPESAKRIGKAIELTLSGFGDSIGEASIGAGAGPVHLSAGGFGTWLQNSLGVPGKVASQKADTIRQAMQDMTPEERQAYDATMSELSVMAGLRSLSKSSAAMGSIKLIENEIPKIGVNSANSQQFYDQLGRVGRAIANAVNTPGLFPKVKDPKTGEQVPIGISPEMMERIKGLPAQMEGMKTKTSPSGKLPTPKTGKPGSGPKTAEEYLQQLGQ